LFNLYIERVCRSELTMFETKYFLGCEDSHMPSQDRLFTIGVILIGLIATALLALALFD